MSRTMILKARLRLAGKATAVVGTTVAALASLGAHPGMAEVVRRETPQNLALHSSCAPEEEVQFSGSALEVASVADEGPTVKVSYHVDFQNTSGVGRTSGDVYRFQESVSILSTVAKGFSRTAAERLELVRLGADADAYGAVTMHVTADPAGNVTVSFELHTVDCGASATPSRPRLPGDHAAATAE